MVRSLAVLLVAGCVTLQVWAQAPQEQGAPAQAPAAAAQPAQSGFPLDQFQEFSAIVTGDVVPGREEARHIYRSHDLMRIEGSAQLNYFVTDLKKQQSHGLAVPGCIKLDTPYSRSFPFFLSGPDYKYERVPAGEETVDGHVCRVEDVTINAPKHPVPIQLRFWEAEDLQGFPVRIANRRKGGRPWVLEYKNVVLGPQDPTLFLIPSKCQQGIDKAPKKAASPNPTPKKAPAGKSQ